MGFRFQRRIKILPGIRVNLSKSGVSTSIGRRGAWFTIGPKGTRTTVGIPGTGLSYTKQTGINHAPADDSAPEPRSHGFAWAVGVVVVFLVVAWALSR